MNLLVNIPADFYEELLTPMVDMAEDDRVDIKEMEYDGKNMEAVTVLLGFLDRRLSMVCSEFLEKHWKLYKCLERYGLRKVIGRFIIYDLFSINVIAQVEYFKNFKFYELSSLRCSEIKLYSYFLFYSVDELNCMICFLYSAA